MNDSSAHARRPLWARLARFLLIAAGAFLLLCALAAVAVPLLMKQVLLPRIGDSIGRQIAVEKVRFNPFKLTLTAAGLRVSGREPGVDFVTVADVEADLSIASIRHLAPVVDGLRITAPVIDLYREPDGRFNFSDIVDRLQAAPAEPAADGKPVQFALRNFELAGGEVRLDDRLLQQKHRVSELRVGVPFISSLERDRNTPAQPSVSASVNGSPLNLAGETAPFSDSRETRLDLSVQDLEIATYLPLAPVRLALVVDKGRVGTALKVEFRQEAGNSTFLVAGNAQVDDLKIDAPGGARLVSMTRARIGLDRIEPLLREFLVGELEIEGLDLEVERRADGTLPLTRAFVPQQTPAARPADASSPAADADLRWSLRSTKIAGARVGFVDRTVSPVVQLVHTDIDVEMEEVGNRQTQAAAAKLSLKQGNASSLSWTGDVDLSKSRARGRLDASLASLAPYRPYLAALQARLDTGAVKATGGLALSWARSFSLELADAKASVHEARLTLPDETKPSISWDHLAAEGIGVSLEKRSAQVARVELAGAQIEVERDQAGNLNLQRLVAPAKPAGPATSTVAARPTEPTRPDSPAPAPAPALGAAARAEAPQAPGAWSVQVARVDLARNQVAWRDLGAARPVSVGLSDINGSVEQVGSNLATPSRIDLKARIGQNGSLTAAGSLVAAPLSAQLAVQVRSLGLAAFDPYLADKLALSIDEGALGTTGKLEYADDRVRYRGRLEVDGFRSRERATPASSSASSPSAAPSSPPTPSPSSSPAIRWNKLLLDDVDVDVDPATLGPDDRISVGAITLSEFFARVLLNEQGRFNLQDIVITEASTAAKARAAAQAASKEAGAAEGGGTSTQAAQADEGKPPEAAGSPAEPPAATTVPTATTATTAPSAGPTIRVGRMKLERGSSNFTDRFVQPNYSVNLTDLDGSLAAMASDDPKPADLTLNGRVDGSAPVDISGKINPFGPTLYTDVHAVAKGIDLPTLTPYSLKYAGYAIEKGKMSLDVHYIIENEQLRADNHLFLDQLTLGDKVEGPGASSLPVQFALSLLKNSKGEIDVTLPISGSLDDPQFSVAGLIGRAIGNLLTRVVTAPFSALAAAFGGSVDAEELSFVEFNPGTSTLGQDSVKRLQALSKALVERPVLKLEIAGRVDPKAEEDAIRKQRLEARLKALKRRGTEGTDRASPGREDEKQPPARQAQLNQEEAAIAAGVTLSKEEYPVLLKQLYDESGLAEKARPASPAPAAAAGDRPAGGRASAGSAGSNGGSNAGSSAGSSAGNAGSAGSAREGERAAAAEIARLEKALLESIPVDAESVRRLATRRSQVVRRWLAVQGKVQEDRMFLLAPRLSPEAMGPNQSKPQCPASCAEFSLR